MPALQMVYVNPLGVLVSGPALQIICQGPIHPEDRKGSGPLLGYAFGNSWECARTRFPIWNCQAVQS